LNEGLKRAYEIKITAKIIEFAVESEVPENGAAGGICPGFRKARFRPNLVAQDANDAPLIAAHALSTIRKAFRKNHDGTTQASVPRLQPQLNLRRGLIRPWSRDAYRQAGSGILAGFNDAGCCKSEG